MATGLTKDQTAIYLKDMYKAEREGEKTVDPMYGKIFKVETKNITGGGDKRTQLLGTGRLDLHEVENQDINFRAPVEGWSFYCRYWRFSDGLSLSKEAVEDVNHDKVKDILRDIANTWGESCTYEKETFGARVFNNGGALAGDYVFNGTHTGNTDPSGNLLYDSKPLFNLTGNARTSKGGATYYNAIAGAALSVDNFQTLYELYTVSMAHNEQDFKISNTPDTLLTESGAQEFLAKRICQSESLPGGQMNDINPIKGLVTPMAWRFLSDSSAFYIGKKQHPKFIWRERQAPEIRFFRDETNKSYKASIDIRFGVWITTFRAWAKSGGTFA